MNGPDEDAPDNVDDVDDYLVTILEDPELEWEWELRGAIYFANRLMPDSVDGIRMWARVAFRELRRQGQLRHQRKAAKISGATKTSKNVASMGREKRRTCQRDDFDPFSL